MARLALSKPKISDAAEGFCISLAVLFICHFHSSMCCKFPPHIPRSVDAAVMIVGIVSNYAIRILSPRLPAFTRHVFACALCCAFAYPIFYHFSYGSIVSIPRFAFPEFVDPQSVSLGEYYFALLQLLIMGILIGILSGLLPAALLKIFDAIDSSLRTRANHEREMRSLRQKHD